MSTSNNTNNTTVYNAEKDKEVPMHKIPINEKDKQFLKSLYDSAGPLTTTEIKQQTGLTRQNIKYRYNKFGRDTYTEIINVTKADPEDQMLDDQYKGMNQAEITQKGRTLIDQGLIGDPTEDHTTNEETHPNAEEHKERINTLENKVNALSETVDTQKETIRKLNQQTNENQDKLQSFEQWRTRINTFVMATRTAMKELGITFSKHLKEAKQEIQENEDQED